MYGGKKVYKNGGIYLEGSKGIMVEMLNEIAAKLKFKYDFHLHLILS